MTLCFDVPTQEKITAGAIYTLKVIKRQAPKDRARIRNAAMMAIKRMPWFMSWEERLEDRRKVGRRLAELFPD